jgi:hypothetical protein
MRRNAGDIRWHVYGSLKLHWLGRDYRRELYRVIFDFSWVQMHHKIAYIEHSKLAREC